jgi:WD40 repeat protein
LNNYREVKALEGYPNEIRGLDFSEDGELLVTGSDDKSVKVYSTKDWTLKQNWQEHTSFVYSVKFCPNSNNEVIASAGGDNSVKIWNPSE